MAIITRLSRLFRADFHAVLDRMEEPDVLLRQALREMEEALAGDERRERHLVSELEENEARRAGLQQSLASLGEELDVCFESAQDGLARSLIKRRLEADRMLQLLQRKGEAQAKLLTELRARVREQRDQLESLRQKAALLDEEKRSATAREAWRVPESLVRDEDVEIAFLREKQRRAQS